MVTRMSRLDDDGCPSSDFIAVEDPHADGQQALWIGVRPIWYGDRRGEVMVQICYQQHHMAGPLAGPVWLSPETWDQVDKAVRWRLRRYKKHWWQRKRTRNARM